MPDISTKNTTYRASSSRDYGTLHSIIAQDKFEDYNHHELRYYDTIVNSGSRGGFSSSSGFSKSSKGGFGSSKSSFGSSSSSSSSAFSKNKSPSKSSFSSDKKKSSFSSSSSKSGGLFGKKKDDEKKTTGGLFGSKSKVESKTPTKPAIQQQITTISQQLQIVSPDLNPTSASSSGPFGKKSSVGSSSSSRLGGMFNKSKVSQTSTSTEKKSTTSPTPKIVISKLNMDKFKSIAQTPSSTHSISLSKTEKPAKLTRSVFVDTPQLMSTHRTRKTLRITPRTERIQTTKLNDDFLTPSRGMNSNLLMPTSSWSDTTAQDIQHTPYKIGMSPQNSLNILSSFSTTKTVSKPSKNPPILTKANYVTKPSLKELQSSTEEELAKVESFSIENMYGSIRWMDTVDLNNVNLDSCVEIKDAEVIVYPNEEEKPQIGEKLNGRALVTLFNIFPEPNQTSEEFEKLLASINEEINCRFVSFDSDGKWSFEVPHF
eukprot:TRINITY_DN14153_c0_g1_i1.p1 TRINITY_DN14153_c0_g1~~TRINITY_DN14153_c0_g1_i1.p1  ORF type:complete len:497 (+),score=120.89 TRINITY_DN14153_c0_g1_i1:35-1492(+)